MAQIDLYNNEQVQISGTPIMLQSFASTEAVVYISVDGVEIKSLSDPAGKTVTLPSYSTKIISGLPEGCYIRVRNIPSARDFIKILY